MHYLAAHGSACSPPHPPQLFYHYGTIPCYFAVQNRSFPLYTVKMKYMGVQNSLRLSVTQLNLTLFFVALVLFIYFCSSINDDYYCLPYYSCNMFGCTCHPPPITDIAPIFTNVFACLSFSLVASPFIKC